MKLRSVVWSAARNHAARIGNSSRVWSRGLRVVAVAIRVAIALAALACMAAPVHAQLLAQVPGVTDDIVVAGDLVYVAGGAGVQIIDLVDPAHPQLLSSYGTPGWPLGLDLVGSRLYVADGTDTSVFPYQIGAGLLILDVSSPAAPAELGRFETPGIASGIEVAGSLAYLVDDSLNPVSAGLRIIDVSTPGTPTEVGSVVGFSSMHDGDLELPLAFGVSAYGFGIADVSIPAMPQVRVVLPIATSAVHAVGNLAYVASGFFDWEDGPALRIYDVSDPADPVSLSETLSVSQDGAEIGRAHV